MAETAERLYDALVPYNQADTSGDLRSLTEALCDGDLERVHELVSDTDNHEGLQTLFDVDACPAYALPFLAQLVGVELEPSLTEAQAREKIRTPEGFARGTIATMTAAIKRTLSGSQTVLIDERFGGSAYAIRVRTFDSETASAAVTEAVVRAVKPGGLALTYESLVGQDWADLEASATDWADVEASYDDWLDVATTLP